MCVFPLQNKKYLTHHHTYHIYTRSCICPTIFKVLQHPLQSTTRPSSEYHTTLFKVLHHPLQTTTRPPSKYYSTLFKVLHHPLQSTTRPPSEYHATLSKIPRHPRHITTHIIVIPDLAFAPLLRKQTGTSALRKAVTWSSAKAIRGVITNWRKTLGDKINQENLENNITVINMCGSGFMCPIHINIHVNIHTVGLYGGPTNNGGI